MYIFNVYKHKAEYTKNHTRLLPNFPTSQHPQFLMWMRSSLVWMRSSLVVRASDCQCTSCNGPGFDPNLPKKYLKKKKKFLMLCSHYNLAHYMPSLYSQMLSHRSIARCPKHNSTSWSNIEGESVTFVQDIAWVLHNVCCK
jgi:hypothetical protein